MNTKAFGVITGVIISLAIAMFVGLYMLGLSGQGHNPDAPIQYYRYSEGDGGYDYADIGNNIDDFYLDEGLGELPTQ